MAEPKKVSQEEYDDLRGKMEEKYGYDKMSEDDKAKFDKTFDESVTVDDKKDNTDQNDDDDDDTIDNGKEHEIEGKGKNRDDDDDDRFL